MHQTRLLVDAGNSRVKFGLFDGSLDPTGLPACRHDAIVRVQADWPWETIRNWCPVSEWQHVSAHLAGSNPAEISRLTSDWPKDWNRPERIGYAPEIFPLVVELPQPHKAGIDRLLNAIAANRLREPGQTVIIVDSGTATTVDAVDAQGRFLGGAILPGFELSAKALHDYTAVLPLIPFEELESTTPPDAIGRHTKAAMTSGLYWGLVGAVQELIRQYRERSEIKNPLILTTGGGGELVARHTPGSRCFPHLSLQGLAIVLNGT